MRIRDQPERQSNMHVGAMVANNQGCSATRHRHPGLEES